MAYKKIFLANVAKPGKIAFRVIMDALNVDINEAQRLIDKKRVFCDGILLDKKNAILCGKIEIIDYESKARGLKPVFECEKFAIFDKPSGILSHPNGRNCEYSLCDEIWARYGKMAAVAHRLDKETSGLILVAKNKEAQKALKSAFEKKIIEKSYVALVFGEVNAEFIVDKAMKISSKYDEIKTRMQICDDGKAAKTLFKRLEFFPKFNASLVLAKPLTGRQHQIRLHLFHAGHKILGEPLYGLEKSQIEAILDKKLNLQERVDLTGAARLCLHSFGLKFEFEGQKFNFNANLNEIKKAFLRACELIN